MNYFIGFLFANLILSFANALSQEYIIKYQFLHNFNIIGTTDNQLRINPISK